MLWYLCLRYAYLVLQSTVALKVASIVVAVAAVVILLARAPLPLWMKLLFTFSIPLYEYSVIARNYGLGMLWLFVFCALYPRRGEHPIALALALACLANSHAMGFMIAIAAGVMLAIDTATEGRTPGSSRWHPGAVAVYLFGVALFLVTSLPDASQPELYHHTARDILAAIVAAVLRPARHLGVAPSLCIWLYLLTLVRRPGLLCFALLNLVGFELVFTLAFPPNQSRIGYIMLVIFATIWLDAANPEQATGRPARVRLWVRRGLVLPLIAVLSNQMRYSVHLAFGDLRGDYSSSRRLGALIARDPRLGGATVTGEPETPLQALPYYRDNRIYLPQERVFRRWIRVVKGRRQDFSLSELLRVARELRDSQGQPVVIALGWRLDGPDEQKRMEGTLAEQRFTSTPESRAEFVRQTERLASFRDARFTDENYDVFVLW